jgi:tetratricopeptide (TPR) repeat protein
MSKLCGESEIQGLVNQIQSSQTPQNDIAMVNELLQSYPSDPRLHFLRGSVLVGAGQHIDAHAAYSKALEIAPDFAIARFQLGFFELTSGERAMATLAPLDGLPDENYLKVFSRGLFHLVRDEFEQAINCFRSGMRLNEDNLPLNNDMQLLIDECTPLAEAVQTGNTSVSETSLILNQFTKTSGNS